MVPIKKIFLSEANNV